MTGMKLYMMYNAMALHFNKKSSYDYLKYNGVVRLTKEKYLSCPYRWTYEKLSKRYEHESKTDKEILLAAFNIFKNGGYVDQRTFVSKLSKDESVYKRVDLSCDIEYLARHYHAIESMVENSGLYPSIYKEYEHGNITLECFLLFTLSVINCLEQSYSADVVRWPNIISDLNKSRGFVGYLYDHSRFSRELALAINNHTV